MKPKTPGDASEPLTNRRDASWKSFPSGSLGEYNLPRELATVLARAQSSKVYDVSGREYVDLTMGWGSVLLGHADPAVVDAVTRQAALGSNYAYVSAPILRLAEEMIETLPVADCVRFCASGTEATAYAVRFARAFTKRPGILKFEGAYHGANDVGTLSLFPQALRDDPVAQPTSAGLAPGVSEHVLVAPFNDLETTRRILKEHAHELAAVIVEPLHRCTTPVAGFLQGLREATSEHGMLLLFDEVVTGFRLAYGGAQEYYGVVPDLAAYGKALGGGYPIGALAGRREILELCCEDRLGAEDYVWFASSLGGNPVTAVAALATLERLRQPDAHERLFALGEELRSGLRDVLEECDVPARVLGDGPLCAVAFTSDPVTDYRSAFRADRARARAFLLGLFERGVFLNPMSTKFYLSLAHDKSDLDRVLTAAKEVLSTSA